MPLLDAALAFSLTMLAVASLSSQILAWLDQWRNVRSAKLKQMLLDFVTRQTYQAVRRAEGYAIEKGERIQTNLVRRLRGFAEEPTQQKGIAKLRQKIGAQRVDDLDETAREWVRSMGIADLVERIDVEHEASISGHELIDAVKQSDFFTELSDDASEKVDSVLEALTTQWNRLEERYVAAFRQRAQLINTLVCLAIALVFNINALQVLNMYMGDEQSRNAVVAQQSAVTARAEAEAPTTVAELQQQAAAFEEPAFPVGWDQFPNCPPNSVDSRCLGYWQSAVGGLGLGALSYADRLAINPARYPTTALFGRVVPAGDDEDAGLARARIAAQERYGGNLLPMSFIGWFGGCLLTALLGGLGSPFWFEVVRRMATARENMRKDSLEAVGHVSAHADITPANAAPAPRSTEAGPTQPTNAEASPTPPAAGDDPTPPAANRSDPPAGS